MILKRFNEFNNINDGVLDRTFRKVSNVIKTGIKSVKNIFDKEELSKLWEKNKNYNTIIDIIDFFESDDVKALGTFDTLNMNRYMHENDINPVEGEAPMRTILKMLYSEKFNRDLNQDIETSLDQLEDDLENPKKTTPSEYSKKYTKGIGYIYNVMSNIYSLVSVDMSEIMDMVNKQQSQDYRPVGYNKPTEPVSQVDPSERKRIGFRVGNQN